MQSQPNKKFDAVQGRVILVTAEKVELDKIKPKEKEQMFRVFNARCMVVEPYKLTPHGLK